MLRFAKGSKVSLRKKGLPFFPELGGNRVYTVAAVANLPNPDAPYVDPFYWESTAWATRKTRLEVAGHPQRVFLEGVINQSGLPQDIPDPSG